MSRLSVVVVALVLFAACQPDSPLQPTRPEAALVTSNAVPTNYEMLDLGTLGMQAVTPRMMLDQEGRVLALGVDTDGRIHVLRWDNGTITDLGLVPSREMAFTSRGFGAGRTCTPAPDGCGPPFSFFQWDHGTVTPLETGGEPGWVSGVMDLLDHHEVVLATVQYSDRQAGVIWRDGVRQELPTLDAVHTYTIPLGINKHGQIIAQSIAADFTSQRGTIYDDGVPRDLGALTDALCARDPSVPVCAYAYASPDGINDRGDVVGFGINESGEFRAMIWPGGGPIQEINVAPGQPTQGALINNRGQVIVYAPDGFYVWDNGSVQRAGTLGGSFALVHQWTDDGIAIGWSYTADGGQHAFVWQAGRMTDLGAGPAGGQYAEAISISPHGEILGSYYTPDFQQRMVLWRPVK